MDPLRKEYPWYTPYQFAGNTPIKFIHLDGLEPSSPAIIDGGTVIEAVDNARIASVSPMSEVFRPVIEPGSRSFFSPGIGAEPNRHTHEYIYGVIYEFKKLKVDLEPVFAHFGIVNDAAFSAGDNGRIPYYNQKKSVRSITGPGLYIKTKYPAEPDKRIISTVEQIKANLATNPLQDGEQLNLLGGSGGSVIIAQTALMLAEQGHYIDNVILLTSPVNKDSELFKSLSSHARIGRVIYDEVQVADDQITGISSRRYQVVPLVIDGIRLGDKHPHARITWDPKLWRQLAEGLIIQGGSNE